MKIPFEYFAFLLYFSMIIVKSEGSRGMPGGCTWKNVTDEDLKKDKYLRDGKQHILDSRTQYYHSKGYDSTLKIPDLKVCEQVVAGMFYHFSWTVEDLTDPNTGKITKSYTVNCTAGYIVQSWLKHFEFQGPECKN